MLKAVLRLHLVTALVEVKEERMRMNPVNMAQKEVTEEAEEETDHIPMERPMEIVLAEQDKEQLHANSENLAIRYMQEVAVADLMEAQREKVAKAEEETVPHKQEHRIPAQLILEEAEEVVEKGSIQLAEDPVSSLFEIKEEGRNYGKKHGND